MISPVSETVRDEHDKIIRGVHCQPTHHIGIVKTLRAIKHTDASIPVQEVTDFVNNCPDCKPLPSDTILATHSNGHLSADETFRALKEVFPFARIWRPLSEKSLGVAQIAIHC